MIKPDQQEPWNEFRTVGDQRGDHRRPEGGCATFLLVILMVALVGAGVGAMLDFSLAGSAVGALIGAVWSASTWFQTDEGDRR